MPYSPEHKAETRKKIVASARRLFNRRGLSDVSIDEIMGDAGLTRGGFYNHFSTKEELYAEAITQVLDCEKLDGDGKPIDMCLPPDRMAQEIVSAYLSDGHYNEIDMTCSLVTFPTDAAHGGKAVREAYQKVLEGMICLFEMGVGSDAKARQKAITMATLCVGGMVLARAVQDDALARELRSAAHGAALETGGFIRKPLATAAE